MNLGFPEMIFIFLIALIIFGPKKLPEIGRQIGKVMNDFKRASNEFKSQIESEISQLEHETKQVIISPSQPPMGAIASNSTLEMSPPLEISAPSEVAALPEPESMSKAPDA